ncbi:hypothetical protein OG818_41135 [Streptomyces virginiae]|uniref:hypothetical protein n=1 Tax=Streptomyces virginiae TaxID=1961 RepID=UPI00224C8311|nr:hypothetical protein [Streptomyces virginiae]MCX4722100.1 hypothetical protein [Streptomyces virginiae]
MSRTSATPSVCSARSASPSASLSSSASRAFPAVRAACATSSACPPARPVPAFPPLRVGRGGDRLRRAVRRRRRAASAALAVVAAAVAVGGTEAQASRGAAARPEVRASQGAAPPAAVRMVSAPVRIADAATVGLLRPGDRVDVVAAERTGPPEVVAAGALVAEVPDPDKGVADGGALVVLSVPRETARVLVGTGATTRLAVTLC